MYLWSDCLNVKKIYHYPASKLEMLILPCSLLSIFLHWTQHFKRNQFRKIILTWTWTFPPNVLTLSGVNILSSGRSGQPMASCFLQGLWFATVAVRSWPMTHFKTFRLPDQRGCADFIADVSSALNLAPAMENCRLSRGQWEYTLYSRFSNHPYFFFPAQFQEATPLCFHMQSLTYPTQVQGWIKSP